MATKTSVRKDVARNRERLLAAADELVAEKGLDLSLNELAHRAGLGVGTVYRHFADRDEVIGALFEGRVERLAALLEQAAEIEDPLEALRVALFSICELQAADIGVFHAVASARTPQQRASLRTRIVPQVERILARAVASGRVRADLKTSDVPMILFMCGAASEYASSVRPGVWRRYLEIMYDGLLVAPAEPRSHLSIEALDDDEIERAIISTTRRRS